MTYRQLFTVFLSLLSLILDSVAGRLVNVTVDDTYTDSLTGTSIIYAPPDRWNEGGCAQCQAKPDSSLTSNGTWHDAIYDPNSLEQSEIQTATLHFNGSAVYVFGILSLSEGNPFSTADLSFFIDGDTVGHFNFTPPGQDTYQYNILLYANISMLAGQHSLTLQNGHVGGNLSLVLLDKMVYTREEDDMSSENPPSASDDGHGGSGFGNHNTSSHSRSSHKQAIIIACVVALTVVLIVVMLLLLYLFRRHTHNRTQLAKTEEPRMSTVPHSPEVTPYTHRPETGPVVVPQTKGHRRQPVPSSSQSDGALDSTAPAEPSMSPAETSSVTFAASPWSGQDSPPPYEASTHRIHKTRYR